MEPLVPIVLETPRPLPVILLLDTSGSMSGAKMAALNSAVRELTQELAGARQPQGEVHVGMVGFGQNIDVRPPEPAEQVRIEELIAGGTTPMGAALDACLAMLGDPRAIPARAYTPTLVLVSDGQPTDHFDRALKALLADPRGSRATRLALAIGEDADVDVLRRFVAHPEIPVVRAGDVGRIRDFFRWVTYSVKLRTRSRRPDQALIASPAMADLSDDDLIF